MQKLTKAFLSLLRITGNLINQQNDENIAAVEFLFASKLQTSQSGEY
ncbi:hypothetical protein [Chryseobacterium sp.]|nr:hypothetical protein [Chryseobacterium sp.]